MTTHKHLDEESTTSEHELTAEPAVHEDQTEHHKTHCLHEAKDTVAEHETSAHPAKHDLVPVSDNVISFRISRQTLVLAALVILVGISAFESVELARLHQALQIWKALPAVAASPTNSTSTAAPSSSGNALPSQVGGC